MKAEEKIKHTDAKERQILVEQAIGRLVESRHKAAHVAMNDYKTDISDALAVRDQFRKTYWKAGFGFLSFAFAGVAGFGIFAGYNIVFVPMIVLFAHMLFSPQFFWWIHARGAKTLVGEKIYREVFEEVFRYRIGFANYFIFWVAPLTFCATYFQKYKLDYKFELVEKYFAAVPTDLIIYASTTSQVAFFVAILAAFSSLILYSAHYVK